MVPLENGKEMDIYTVSSDSADKKTVKPKYKFWHIDREMLRFKIHFFMFIGGNIEQTQFSYLSKRAGTPQGSILSPLLYSLYTYDFPTSPTVEVCLFADDAAILSQARSPETFTHTEKKRPPGVGSLNIGSPLSENSPTCRNSSTT
ncbi:hypothetical protein TNCV_756751 [Trichonephila clavipes]|nr:hypothetical protein TNCV_756751 [Trichonephila clavipes]